MGAPFARRTSARILSAGFLISSCLVGFLLAPSLRAQIAPQQGRSITGSVKLRGRATTEQRIEVQLLSSDRRPVQRVFADTLGNFQFTDLGPGVYIIAIE